MSRDKHLCPGTSRDKITFPKEHKKQEKDVPKQENDQISCFRTSFSCFRTSFPVLEHPFPVLEHPFLLCPVLSRVPSRILAVPARPVPDFSCPGPSRPLARFWACPVVPLSRDNEETSVPLSRKVVLSRPVGNPNMKYDCISNSFCRSGVIEIRNKRYKSIMYCHQYFLVVSMICFGLTPLIALI